ncbi:MAG TPA: hypothetical protein VHT48_03610 [Methylocella sp.]|nr:hypothetical protein [Methylocella sp.]
MLWKSVEAIGLATVIFVPMSHPAAADGFDGTYRGTLVCDKLNTTQFMLRAPFDVIVTGKNVVAARPVFNRKGTVVVGSEIATGTIADDGTIKLSSNWKAGGSSYQGSYGGVLTEKSGTLTGTQAWTMPEGQQTRTCTAALVRNAAIAE